VEVVEDEKGGCVCPTSLGALLPLATGIYVLTSATEDGKEMNLDLSKMRITEVMEEVDRHSRQLARKEELLGN
tara:strand:+ start:662 stop:880 length:219 start_codon:yes stop_codon:yes gene_type:complete